MCPPTRKTPMPLGPAQVRASGGVGEANLSLRRRRLPPKTLTPPQIAPCQHHQSTDDDPKNLPPAEARRPPQTHLISEQ